MTYHKPVGDPCDEDTEGDVDNKDGNEGIDGDDASHQLSCAWTLGGLCVRCFILCAGQSGAAPGEVLRSAWQ